MKKTKIFILLFIIPLLLESSQRNIIKEQLKIEKRAFEYYYQADYENYFNTILNLIEVSPYTMLSRFYLSTIKIEKVMIKNYEKIFPLLEKLIKDSDKLDFFTYQLILDDLISHYLQKGQIEKARILFKKTAYINRWLYTSPFVKTFYNDINENFYNIENSLFFQEAKNYKWQKLPAGTDWGWVPLEFVLYPGTGITAYAGFNFYLPEVREIIIWITAYSSTKLFIDTQTIFTNDMVTDKGEINLIYRLKLRKGWHHLIVKSSSKKDSPDFKLRMFSAEGKIMHDLKISLDNKKIPKSPIIKKQKIYPEIYHYFINQIKKHPYNTLNYLRKSILEFTLFNTKQAQRTLLKAVIINKKNPLLNYYPGRFYYDNYTYSKKNYEIEKARRFFEETLKLKKDFIRAKEYLANCYLSLNKIDKAYHYISELFDKEEYVGVQNLKGKYFYKIDWNYMYIKNLEKSCELNKNYLYPFRKIAEFYNKYDAKVSLKMYKQIFKKNYRKNENLLDSYLKSKKYNKLIKNLNYLGSISPYIENYYKYFALYYKITGQYREAIEILNKLYNSHPYPWVLQEIGNLYYETGRYNMAKRYWLESLDLQPENFEIEDRVHFLKTRRECEKNLEDKFYPIDTMKIIKKAFKTEDTKNDAKYYLDLMLIKINKNGTFKYLTHQIIKILNEKAKETYGEIRLPYGDNVKIIKIGTYLEPDNFIEATDYKYHDNSNYISIPSLKVGALIEIWYEVNVSTPWLDRTYYFYYPPFMFQDKDAEVENSIFVVIKLRDYPEIKFTLRNGEDIDFSQKEKDKEIIYIWKKDFSEALEKEYNSPSIFDIVPNIFVSSIPDWSIISKWYYGRIKEKFITEFEMEQKILELYEKSKINHRFSPRKFIENVYYWIQQNISSRQDYLYYSEPVDEVFFKKQGNAEEKALLMKQMLNGINMNSYIVLARNRNFSQLDFKTPTPDAFDAILLYVPLKDADYWIDFQEKYLPFGYIKFAHITTNGFLIDDKGNYKFVKITPISNQNIIKEEFTVKLKEGFSTVMGKIVYSGIFNIGKKDYADPTGRDTQIMERINRCIEGISILNYSISNIENIRKNMVIKFDGEIETKLNQNKRIDLIFDKFKLSDRYISKLERKYPLRIYNPLIKEIRTIVNTESFTDKRLKLEKGIQSLHLKKAFGEYSLSIKFSKNQIIITRKINILPTLILPEDYKDFLEFCRTIDKAEDEEFKFVQ